MNLQHQTKRIFSVALIVWMSGIVLFFCCDMPHASAANTEIESCPLAKKAHCSKTSEGISEHSFETEKLAFECCNFPAKFFDKARKLEAPQSSVAVKVVTVSAPQYFLLKKFSAAPNFYQSFVFNRENTYLRNRVFRI